MPVRTPSNRGGNTIGWFASYKMRRSIAYESLLECDYLYLLDFADEVVAFEEQPLTITYQHAGRTHRYTPDFRVSQGGHELLIECKPLALVGTDENRRKFAAGEAWAARARPPVPGRHRAGDPSRVPGRERPVPDPVRALPGRASGPGAHPRSGVHHARATDARSVGGWGGSA